MKLRAALVALMLVGLWQLVAAQPNHTRPIFTADLQSSPTAIGTVWETAGNYSSAGWTAKAGGQMKIMLNDWMPFEGTLSVDVKGMSGTVVGDDWIPFSVWSRGHGKFRIDAVKYPNDGSFLFAKTDPSKVSGSSLGFKLFSKPIYDPVNFNSAQYDPISMSAAETYTLKFVWTPGKSYFQVFLKRTGQKIAETSTNFVNQSEAFLFIFLGKSNEYSSMAGVTYSNLTLLGPLRDMTFLDVSRSSGAVKDTTLEALSVAWADVNMDGKEDIYVSYYNKPNKYFVSAPGSNTFTETAAASGLDDSGGSFSTIFADFSGDGKIDAFVGDYGTPSRLLINKGNDLFENEAGSRNISTTNGKVVNPLAIDVENDGDIDIFVANNSAAHELYVNNGSGVFTRIELSSLPIGEGPRAAAGDVNNDGYVDIFYGRRNAPAVLLINNKTGGFEDKASSSGLAITTDPGAPTLADLDNDNDLDLVFPWAPPSSSDSVKIYIYRNSGGSFTQVPFVDPYSFYTYGVAVGDYDNDGLQDIYAARRNKASGGRSNYGSRVYRNTSTSGGITFAIYPGTGAEVIYQESRGSAAADYDGDGKLDIYTAARGAVGSNKRNFGRNFLLKNTSTTGNNFLLVNVLDKKKLPGLLGAKVELFDQTGVTGKLLGFREINSIQGYQSQPGRMLHFGMGGNTAGVLRVTLPDKRVILKNVNANSLATVDPYGADPVAIAMVKGNNQSAASMNAVPDSLIVRVYSGDLAMPAQFQPLEGQNVTFKVKPGGGGKLLLPNGAGGSLSLDSANVATDGQGLARVKFQVGPTAGTSNNVVEVYSYNKSGQLLANYPLQTPVTRNPVTFTASTTVGPAADFSKTAGDFQQGYSGDFLTDQLEITVTDVGGNPVSGAGVNFSIASGSGTLGDQGVTQVKVTSLASGKAAIKWRLGAAIGTQTAQVTVDGITGKTATFTATATAPLRILSYISGDSTTGTVNQSAQYPLVVKLTDAQGSAVPLVAVRFTVIAGGGKLNGQTMVEVPTGSDGTASIYPVLGTVAGDLNNVFQATCPSAKGTINFRITARAGSATKMTEISGNGKSGKVGRLLSVPFVVQITDAFGNAVKGYSVDYSVTAGGGTVNGEAATTVSTDKNGYASIYYRLGTSIGTNAVTASGANLSGSPVIFTANAEAGSPAMLFKISGDGQKGTLGVALIQPLVVALSDSFSNPIPEHPVQFRVSRGNGTIEGQTYVSVNTNSLGRAQVIFTLGTSDYINEVTVSSQYLGLDVPTIPSPLVFSAMVSAGDPAKLVYVSGNYQLGAINKPLPEPFVVKVTDAHGVPVPDHTVTFAAFSPGANFSGATLVSKKSDDNGLVSIQASIGSNPCDICNTYEAISDFNGVPLEGSPIQIYASGRITTARKLIYVSGNGSTGTVGKFLADTLKVRAVDASDRPVAGQPITFHVESGDGLLDGEYSTREVNSGSDGLAKISLKFGSTPGNVRISASTMDGMGAQLQNSPIMFEVTALIGASDPFRSTLVVTSPVIADGKETGKVIVTLRDDQGNPVPNKQVSIFTKGLDVRVNQPATTTDLSGQTQGSISSTRTGSVKIWTVVENRHVPQDTARMTFVAGSPVRSVAFGSGQIALRGAALPLPLGVTIYDANNNPVPDVSLTFRVKSGGGSIVQPQPVTTDANGRAQVNWVLGSKIGEQYITVVIPRISSTEIEFWAIAKPPEPQTMTVVRGNRQIGYINQVLPDSFIVAMRDSAGAPAEGLSIIFSQTKGQGQFVSPNPVTTDKRGYAAVLYKPGAVAGEYAVTAYHTSGLVKEIPFIVQSEPTVFLSKLKDAKSSARPYEEMEIQLLVSDAYNRPLANQAVKFEILEGGGTLPTAAQIQTNATGQASIIWKLGLKGSQKVKASAVNKAGTPLVFSSQVVNAAPVLTVPGDLKVMAGSLLTFGVSAYDSDGDAVSFGARGLPATAQFDSTASRIFSWTPTRAMAQGNPYKVAFIVKDAFNSADTAVVTITVETLNVPPTIDSFEPADTLVTHYYGLPVLFQVSASDLDNDQLSFEWRLNDMFAGNLTELVFQPDQAYFPEDNIILVRVTDGKETRELRWWVHLNVSSVRLSAFDAVPQKGGVLIKWQTAAESENLGFKVLRSQQADGRYEAIVTDLIPANQSGLYSYLDRSVTAGEKYYYKIQDVDRSGRTALNGPVAAEVPMPESIALAQNYPNPFNPSTTISYELPRAAQVELAIYNLQGQLIRTLCSGQMAPGIHHVVWDAHDSQGLQVPTGLYYYRLRVADQVFTRKLLFAK